jgi:hypothetical protein
MEDPTFYKSDIDSIIKPFIYMTFKINTLKIWIAMLVLTCCYSCNDDDPLVPFQVNFTNTAVGIDATTEIEITFSRTVASSGVLIIQVGAGGLNYGADADFYTDPAISNDQITLDFSAGDASVQFTITQGTGLNIQQDEQITFSINEGDGTFEAGENSTATATFSENFIAPSGTMEIDGGGTTFPNQAFIDLSKLNQTTIDKYSWDLGFETIAGSHRVIINNSAYVMARALENHDIDAVTASDTLGFASVMYLSNYEDPAAANWIDHQNGDLDQAAIGSIHATDGENPVYIIKRDGDNRNWKKVRMLQEGDGYLIQHADIDATTHTTTSISKDEAYNFIFFDLDQGQIAVEPVANQWDLMYSTYANRANFGITLAVGFNDFVTINRTGVSVAMVLEDAHAYDEFDSDDLSTVSLSGDNISAIGSSWRSLIDFALVLNEDRFYVIEDTDQHVYKLKFTRLTSIAGERGYPEITFERIL